MLKVWSNIKRLTPSSASGFSVVEVLLAAAVFGFIVTALIGAVVYGRSSTAQAGDRARAVLLADEGIEAVRNINDASFSNMADGTYGVAQSGNQWVFSGTSDTNGIYTRQVIVSTAAADRKTVVSTVSWTGTGGSHSVASTTRLTNWRAAIVAPPTGGGPIMMAYSKTTTTPFYRTWNGTVWSAEGSANAVVGNVNYIVLKSSRTRNEAILGTQTSTGAIYVQVWNGTTWSTPTLVGTGTTTTRSFDISYEKSSDRAVIAYLPTASGVDFEYRIWDGATLSAATAVTASPTTGVMNWIELRQNPLSASNEIAMILLDANADVYGMRWTGSAWNNMGVATVWDATASPAARKGIDVEYEQTSGEALFMWGDSVATDQYYRTWNGTTLGAATLLDIATEGGIPQWVQLAARPNSDQIMYGVLDAGSDLNTRVWSGTAWDTGTPHPEHAATVENITSRVFDIAWETHPSGFGKAWLVWGNGTTVSARQWFGTGWDTTGLLASSDDTSFVRLRADPVSGAVFTGIYEDSSSATDDIWETHLTGGGTVWSAKNTIWGGPTGLTPVFFRIDIATP